MSKLIGGKPRTHASIPALWVCVVSHDAGIALLEVLLARPLDGHTDLGAEAGRMLAIGLNRSLGRAGG